MKGSTADRLRSALARAVRTVTDTAARLDATVLLLLGGSLLCFALALALRPRENAAVPIAPYLAPDAGQGGPSAPATGPATPAPEDPPAAPSAGERAAPSRPADPFLAEIRRRTREDPEAALAWLQETIDGPRRLQGMLEVVALWAARDSEAALLWLESHAEGIARLESLQAGIRLWSEGDPATAAEWIRGMASDGSKAAAARALAGHWGARDPGAAGPWVRSLPTGPVRQSAAAALVEAWMAKEPEKAVRWALREAADAATPGLIDEAVARYAEHDPGGALAFAGTLSDPAAASRAARAYVGTGAQQFPSETARWIAGLRPGDPLYLDSHPSDLMREWAVSDSVAASAWLADQPEGALRQSAAAAFTAAILPYEPAAAAEWSNSLADPGLRVDYLEQSVRAWAARDGEAAAEWIAETELEPQLRAHLADLVGTAERR
jgi:hypothetical protein